VMLDPARRKVPVPPLARWLLGLGIAATLAANVARGLGHGPSGAVVAAWPAVALVGSYELLMMIIRTVHPPTSSASMAGLPSAPFSPDPWQAHATQVFADDLAARRVPSIRTIRTQLHVGQSRAQGIRAHLVALIMREVL
jgi:hypothetical protein